ncbi:uncharacterized protein METZ01_LOCUS11944, partial [marine metagenome]
MSLDFKLFNLIIGDKMAEQDQQGPGPEAGGPGGPGPEAGGPGGPGPEAGGPGG